MNTHLRFFLSTPTALLLAATLLLSACERPAEKALRELKRENYTFTPEDFVAAAAFGDTAVVERFLIAGMDASSPNSKGESALLAAAKGGHAGVVKLLLEHGVDANIPGPEGITPLLGLAAANDSGETARLLLDKGASDAATDNNGWTSLMLAVYNAHPAVVEVLISKNPQQNDQALLVAALTGNEQVVRVLLDHGARPTATTPDGDTALHLAIQQGHQGVAKLLVSRGADRMLANTAGETPTALSTKKGDPEWLRILTETPVESTPAPVVQTAPAPESGAPTVAGGQEMAIEVPATDSSAPTASGETTPPGGTTSDPTTPQWTMAGYYETKFPYTLVSVDSGTALLEHDGDPDRTVTVKKGDSVPDTNFRVLSMRRRITSSKEALSVDMSSVTLENPGTTDRLELTVAMPARSPSSYALLRVKGSSGTIKVRSGETFGLPGNPSRTFEVMDLRPTQVIVRDEATGKTHTIDLESSTR